MSVSAAVRVWIFSQADGSLSVTLFFKGVEMSKTDTSGAKKAALIVLLLVGAANLAYGGWLFFTEGRVELPLFIAAVVTGGMAVVLGAAGKPAGRR